MMVIKYDRMFKFMKQLTKNKLAIWLLIILVFLMEPLLSIGAIWAGNARTTGRGATIVVSTDVCDGVHDEINVASAIAACNGWGTVLLESDGDGFNFSSNLTIPYGVVVTSREQQAVINLATNCSIILRGWTAGHGDGAGMRTNLSHVTIKVPPGYTGGAIVMSTSDGGYFDMQSGLFDGVYLYGTTGTGTGILLDAQATVSGQTAIINCSRFPAITIAGFEYGLKLYVNETVGGAGGAHATIMSNDFSYLCFYNNVHNIYASKGVGGSNNDINANHFNVSTLEADFFTAYGVELLTGEENIFDIMVMGDSHLTSGHGVVLGVATTRNIVRIRGWMPMLSFVNDIGTANIINDTALGVQAVRVTNTTSQTIANATVTTLTFDTEVFDTNGMHSTSFYPSRLYALTSGYYVMSGHAQFETSTVGIRTFWVQANGATVVTMLTLDISQPGIWPVGNVASTPYYLIGGQYIEFLVYQDTGRSINIEGTDASGPLSFEMAKLN